ncbi:MAG: cyclic nucleotide-binding domain-containing protein, partial [Pseudomonadota bacterium]
SCSFTAGQEVMKEGEPGDSMYVIAEGALEIHKVLTMKFGEDDFRETEKTLVVIKAEDHAVTGEMALITEDARSATVTSMDDAKLYKITRENFLNLAQAKPELGFKVIMRLAILLSQRLTKANNDVIRLTTALSIALSH